MSETLSQKDIDALLHAGGRVTTAPPPLEIRPYDFIRPPRVSRERRAALEAIYGRLAVGLQGLLTSRLRATVDVLPADVEQTTFGEFALSLATPCAAFEFKLGEQLAGQGVLDLGNGLAMHVVDRLFGGPGEGADLQRSLTALEQAVVRNLAERSLALLPEAWEDQAPLAPELTDFEANPEMLRAVGREDPVLVATLPVRAGAFAGPLNVCLPMAPLEPWFQERAGARPEAQRRGGPDRARLQAGLEHVQVTLSARLPVTRLSARTVAALAVGQTIETGHPLEAPVEVYVNGRLTHMGSLGQMRRHLGLRIAHPVPAAASPAPRGREGRVS